MDVCQSLKKYGYSHRDISRLNDNVLLDKHIRDMAERLTHDALFKLALLTWHFDACAKSPPRKLLLFLEQPKDQFKKLCEILCRLYSSQTGNCILDRVFAENFAEMLSTLESIFGNGWNLIWQCGKEEKWNKLGFSPVGGDELSVY